MAYISHINMQNFDLTVKSIFREAKKPSESSFSKWIERAQLCREALLENKRQNNEALKDMESTWAPRIIDSKRTELQEQEKGITKIAKEMILEDLENVLAAKEQKYREAMKGPTEEQLRLLSVLQMRSDAGEQLSSSDFANVAPYLADNFHTLKQLANLAKNAGIPFPRVDDTFKSDIENAREGANELLRSINTAKEDLSYIELLFWSTGNAGLYQEFFDKLDHPSYLTVTPEDIQKAAVDKKVMEEARRSSSKGDAASKFCSRVKLTGTESIFAVADQFHVTRAEIAELNPGMDLDHLIRGSEIYIPSVKYSFEPNNPSRVQDSQVTLAEKPVFTDPIGPHGEAVGDDINVIVTEAIG